MLEYIRRHRSLPTHPGRIDEPPTPSLACLWYDWPQQCYRMDRFKVTRRYPPLLCRIRRRRSELLRAR